MRYLIGRYHEVALKGRNRWRFVDQVKHNLRAVFADFRIGEIRALGPRVMLAIPDEVSNALAAERAALVFGIQNFSISDSAELDIAAITRAAAVRTVSGDWAWAWPSPEN